ncbi:MAG: InterPro IPR001173 COGs COG0463, partial [Olavius algarvensis Gamma 1 endosymbiont]
RPRHVQVVARAQGERGTGMSRFASRARRHSDDRYLPHRRSDLAACLALHPLPGHALDVPRKTAERLDLDHGLHLAARRNDHLIHRRGGHLSVEDLLGNQATPLHHREADLCKTTRV